MRSFRFLSLLLVLLVPVLRLAADPVVHFDPAPAWIAPSATPELTPTPEGDQAYGYDYLLLDTQRRLATQELYAHNVYRITSEGSVQAAARFSWDFDPSYETLTLHHLRVIRDGVVQERLKPAIVQVIQQEKDLDRHLLNGDLTALVVLDDVRVGDVIDYAYSRRGWNPVLGGRYAGSFTAAWSVPVRHQRERIVVPRDRTLFHQEHGHVGLALTQTAEDGATVLTWESRATTRIQEEKETPAWLDQYPWVQLTESGTWRDVIDWARPLYAVPDPIPDDVRAKSAELTRGLETDEARTLALLQFVQHDIRYLGMELGAGSHRPNPPAVVLARRFGDCKDKSLLFCTLMRAAGLTAYPALLHTDYRDKLRDWLPTPYAFDHVIACVEDARGRHWVDPTLTSQAGGFAVRGLPDYRLALVLRPGGRDFDDVIRPPDARSVVRAEETFDIADFDHPARLRIRTKSTGLAADSIRRQFAENTPEQISKGYVNYYASTYPGLTAVTPPVLTDDPAHNTTTVEETYDVPKLWRTRESDGRLAAEFYPKFITDYAVRPDNVVRTTPLGIRHPIEADLVTTVHLPEDWTVTPEDTRYEDDAFSAESGIAGHGRDVTMHYRWLSRRDFVPASSVAKFVETLTRFRNGLGYTLTYKKPAPAAADPAPAAPTPARAKPFRLNWLYVLIDLLTLVVLGWSARRLLRPATTPPPLAETPADHALTGLGGWLILVGFGVTLRPVMLVVQQIRQGFSLYDFAVWETLTTPGTAGYHAATGPILVVEHTCNLLLFGFSLINLILFYGRRHTFPAVLAALLLFNPIFLLVDGAACQVWLDFTAKQMASNYLDAGKMIAAAALWVPYVFVSRRVKLTFTR